jgi:hypothetical protein
MITTTAETRPTPTTATLGDLVAAAFDVASDTCPDAREARRLATVTVAYMLQRGHARVRGARGAVKPIGRRARATH